MKKLITFLVISAFVGFSFTVKAQLVALETSATVTGDPSTTLAAHVSIVNTGSSPVVVNVIRSIITNAAGHAISFCWGAQCYISTVSISPIPVTILPGDTNTTFVGNDAPGGVNGIDVVNYTFQDTSDANNKVSKEFTYEFVTGINNLSPPPGNYIYCSQSNIGEGVNITYSVNNPSHAGLIIRNLLGSVIKEVSITNEQGVITVPTYNLTVGIYIYSLYNNDEPVLTKKMLIVRN